MGVSPGATGVVKSVKKYVGPETTFNSGFEMD